MAKMKKCKACGAEIYNGTKVCPQCGKKNNGHKGLIILGIIVILVLICAAAGGIGNISNSKNNKANYIWPTNGIASLLPKPKSSDGEISMDSQSRFAMDVKNVEQEDFNDYVESCKKKGFTVDYSAASSRYRAKDDAGNELTLYYYSNNKEMSIRLSAYKESTTEASTTAKNEAVTEATKPIQTAVATEAPTEAKTAAPTEAPTESSTAAASGSSNNTDFRAWVDSYESFMNEYVDFMKNYNPSDPTSLVKYAQLMSKYSEFVSASDSLNQSDYSTSDWAYYAAAQARVLEKLSQIQ